MKPIITQLARRNTLLSVATIALEMVLLTGFSLVGGCSQNFHFNFPQNFGVSNASLLFPKWNHSKWNFRRSSSFHFLMDFIHCTVRNPTIAFQFCLFPLYPANIYVLMHHKKSFLIWLYMWLSQRFFCVNGLPRRRRNGCNPNIATFHSSKIQEGGRQGRAKRKKTTIKSNRAEENVLVLCNLELAKRYPVPVVQGRGKEFRARRSTPCSYAIFRIATCVIWTSS